MRKIKFNAYIPDLDIILEDITLYGNGQMGYYEDDFIESLPYKYTYDPDMGGVLLIDDENDIFETILTPLYGEDWIWLEENQFIPMQFTGLYDKNGVDIYEGDVVRILYTDWPSKDSNDNRTLDQYKKDISKIGSIIFKDAHYCIKFYSKKYDNFYCDSIFPGKHGEIEIIGNIHKNKDLLNE